MVNKVNKVKIYIENNNNKERKNFQWNFNIINTFFPCRLNQVKLSKEY